MITLKSPMALNSLSSIKIHSDSLGTRIMGNYSIIGSNITAEDLLHMTTQPPEVFVNIDNGDTVLSGNNFNVDNSVKLELINQLFNRIMLYGTNDFTYQDEVFISAILNKIGITDLNEFMSQIKVDIDRNKNLTTLIDKYIDINNHNNKLISIENMADSNKDSQEMNITNRYETDLYIQNEIYKRLETAQNINTIYEYNNTDINNTTVPSLNDITFIEQSDQIELAGICREILAQNTPAVWNQYFSYELKSLNIDELTKENITKRIVMALFENIIDKISYYANHTHDMAVWKNYASLMYKGGTQVIERFKYYQTAYENIDIEEINNYNHDMDKLMENEIELADLILLSNNSEYINNTVQNVIATMLENQNIKKQVSEAFRLMLREKTNDISDSRIYEEERLKFINKARQSYSYYKSLHLGDIPNVTIYNKLKPQGVEASSYDISPDISNTLIENITNIIGENNNVEINTSKNFEDDYITELINRYEGAAYDKSINLAENVEFLEQLNSHNVYMKQLLDSTKEEEDKPPKQVIVDRKKAMENALKALENPEILRREVMENGTAIEMGLPSQIERILSITDDNTRRFYEELISEVYDNTNDMKNYNIDKSVTLEHKTSINHENDIINDTKDTNIKNVSEIIENIIRDSDNTKVINQAIMENNESVEKYSKAVMDKILETINEYEEKLTSDNIYKEKIIDTYTDIFQKEIIEDNINDIISSEKVNVLDNILNTKHTERRSEISLVHVIREIINDEQVEEITQNIQNDKSYNINTYKQTDEAHMTKEEFTNMKKELIRQSEENIKRLVNQNIHTQVHEISDMVYLELEKRLRNEQRRRGY